MTDSDNPRRVLLKLSGEAFGGGKVGIDTQVIRRIAEEIVPAVQQGVQVAIVVGGGNFFRGAELQQAGIDRSRGDYMGMLGTVMNCLALQDFLEQEGQATRVQTAITMGQVAEPYIPLKAIRHLEKGRVVIFGAGAGMPYFSTDTVSIQRSLEIHCDEVLMGKNGVDGVYTAEFDTDSGMFHANEANDGKGTLTVKDGQMTFHVSLSSKKIVNLYVGMAADAEANKADWLLPTTDTVTYSDGTSEEVYGYDIPVAAVDQDFQLALLGTKGKWYDHTVSIRNAQPKAEEAAETPADGEYSVNVTLEGGSGRATVESPAALTVADGKMTAVILWSSPNYDYMIVDGEKYLPTNTEGNSTFEIPVSALGTPLAVTADTVAMSTPHEIEYTLTFTLN